MEELTPNLRTGIRDSAKSKFLSHKIAYADCLAAVLADRINATMVKGDPEFRKLESEIAVEWGL